MKRLILLMIGFVFLIGSPVMSNDFDNDVGIKYVVPSGDIVINQTTISSIELLPCEVTNITILERYNQEVAFAEKHPLVGIATINYNTEYLPYFCNDLYALKYQATVLNEENPAIIKRPYNGNDVFFRCDMERGNSYGSINRFMNQSNLIYNVTTSFYKFKGFCIGDINEFHICFMSANCMI